MKNIAHMRSTLFGIFVPLFLIVAPSNGQATEFVEKEIDDPFSDGTCQAADIVSYGSYIYWWDSKYDSVYWPFTESEWLWSCQKSGFVAFPGDFEAISNDERAAISNFLSENYQPKNRPLTFAEKRELASSLYKVREKGEDFWVWFLRLQAYWAQYVDNNFSAALEYRKQALPLIEKRISVVNDLQEKIQLMFLAGEYYRQLGEIQKMEHFFMLAENFTWTDEDGSNQEIIDYFDELIAQRRKLGIEGNPKF